MAVEKKSVSIDTDLWAQLMKVAGDRPASAVLNEALRQYLWRLDVAAFVAEHEAEHGPITEEERAAARAELAAAMAEATPPASKRRPRSTPKRASA
jgi:Arc/MetJ family transcription regulator